ncbi:hypothetical protein AAF712_005649 [Marasmius tenuissimus]|uniref:Uncharacterized protein n=1 Tax=Marasmius tenuissimus TaxID=585030 RepID=A0ABR3A0V7_9AGAR
MSVNLLDSKIRVKFTSVPLETLLYALITKRYSLHLAEIIEWPPFVLASFMYLTSSAIELLSFWGYKSQVLKNCAGLAGYLASYWSPYSLAEPDLVMPIADEPVNDPQARVGTSVAVDHDAQDDPSVS